MFPLIEWSDKVKKKQTLLEGSLELLTKVNEGSTSALDFAVSLPLEECLDEPQPVREWLVCCLGEIIRIFKENIPVDVELIVDLFTITLPQMASSKPEKVLSILRVLQWEQFANHITAMDNDLYASNWLQMCCELSLCGQQNIAHALPELCVPAVAACPISRSLDLALEAPDLFLAVAKKIPYFTDHIREYFSAALVNQNPIFDAELYSSIAEIEPRLLGGYRMPILTHQNARIRREAVKAYALLDPTNEEWVRRHADKDVKVRRQWVLSANTIGFYDKNEVLYSDSDDTVRMHAYSVPPLPEAKIAIFRILKHPNANVSWDAFLAYGQLSHGATDLEVISRWIGRNPSKTYEALAALRLVFDRNMDSVLFFESPASEVAYMRILAHTLKYYNAIHTFTNSKQASSTRKATAAWLDSTIKDWEELEDMYVDEFSSNFKRNAVPLVSAEWAADHARRGNRFAQRILTLISEKSPGLVKNSIPSITAEIPPYLITAAANVSRKFPLKIVNPTSTILRDICLNSTESSMEAAEILYYGSRSFFEAIAPEIVNRAIEDPTPNTVNALLIASRVVPVSDCMVSISTLSFAAPVYAQICPISELSTWVTVLCRDADTSTRSNVLLEVSKRKDVPTLCFANFARNISDKVALELAGHLKHGKITPRVAPLLFFNDKYSKLIREISPVDDVYGLFTRLVYYLAVRSEPDTGPIQRFLECFASEDNISTLDLTSVRMKHYELKGVTSSLSLYVLSEQCNSIISKYRKYREWSLVKGQEVGFPSDSFAPLSLRARKQVVKTKYVDSRELAELEQEPINAHKRARTVKVNSTIVA